MKKLRSDYFSFSKKERIAVVVLLTLTGIFLVLPYFFRKDVSPPASIPVPAKDSVLANVIVGKPAPGKLFYFNPNTITAEEWKALGLRNRTVKTILNYREKGGRFRQANDIRKIWGLTPAEAEILLPYVRLSALSSKQEKEIVVVSKPGKLLHNIDVNKATVEEWKTLPGIGEVLANRLVRFREKLGRFNAVEQVGKTYGLSDSVFRQLKPYLHMDTLH
ncbi:competence protein ComEA helix-hairpin-helix repeat region [Hydrobacter penzbergensis]|uniref:Competence protein ComEA helix-hairpin-helix repeat region n=1 Tax=Hydrobacter penzbergensis TaxID=1235997 RepID=A0A8X8LF17_9BACT|nr:helix-hairpin-helix domain-containing protein [Hydrobacter penzbergensis]SDW90904.1 competence protein ComEA helix-hairpin-helix repeat region [Hydrobacter penzbergensis]